MKIRSPPEALASQEYFFGTSLRRVDFNIILKETLCQRLL